MKLNLYVMALIVVICTAFGYESTLPDAFAAEVVLVQEGKCICTIIVGDDATAAEKYAAEELRTHLAQIGGCDIVCKTGVVLDSPMIIVGPGKALSKVEPALDLKAMGKEEVVIRTKGPHLILAGGRPRGTLYAVYEFLERYLGCRWYTKDIVHIPKQETIQLSPIDYRYNPPLMCREIWYKETFDRKFGARLRLNGTHHQADPSTGGNVTIFPYVHSFVNNLVQPKTYFDAHPEYYSLRKGKRVPDKQLCLTNPDVLKIVTEQVFKWIEQYPDFTIFEVSQNDGHGPCQCQKCEAIVEEEGSQMGPILRFVNAVADEVAKKHPDKYIDTLSYAYSETPPKISKPRDNVIIRLCHWHPACSFHGVATCPKNKVYRQELQTWRKLAKHLFIWDYMVVFGKYLTPYPNWWAVGDDTRYYAENGVDGVFWQGDGSSSGGEMSDLRAYTTAQMLWHPYQEVNVVINDFLNGVYGPAGKPIREYMEMVRDYVVKENICRARIEVKLTPEMMARARKLFDQAEQLAPTEEIQNRVKKARACIQFQQLCYPKEYGLEKEEARNILNALSDTVKRENITHDRESLDGTMQTWLKEREQELERLYQPISIVVDANAAPRVNLGIDKLIDALKSVSLDATVVKHPGIPADRPLIVVGNIEKDAAIGALVKSGSLKLKEKQLGKEGFVLRSCPDNITAVAGADDSGTLYGCLELADRIKKAKAVPLDLDFEDAPVFILRGPCIGMQKPEITYDNIQYDYRYTPDDFPFFYDKEHWIRYLDFLVDNRMNTLYLWNGHPFTSLLKLPKHPDAQELDDDTLARNIEMFTWLTNEANRRGIWVIQFFYNIHISHTLAKANNLSILHNRPTPFISEYTRYCVSEFVRSYPNVGFMMCLGEALRDDYDADWLCNVIIPGVKDAMRQLNTDKEPPIIVRAHSTPIEKVMCEALKIYKNIYTTHKYNQEVLTWTSVRGESRRLHESLARLGSAHVINVHLLSNLEPFRWGSPSFIQKCMQTCQEMGAKGLHLFPLRYWEWPITSDNVSPRLMQIDRDWIWFAAWARYAWNPNRDSSKERRYWIDQLNSKFDSRRAASKILKAYEASGQCAPRLLRRFGITDGGRQLFSLGMLMTQLINPDRYYPYPWLWQCAAPPGERLKEWVKLEWENKPHEGETPPQVIEDALRFAQEGVEAAEAAGSFIRKNKQEFARFLNDVKCIQIISKSYAAKVRAAMLVLRYGYSNDVEDLNKALPFLVDSLSEYRKLVELTDKTYRDAGSLHTASRQIPFIAGPDNYIHWRQCLPEYEKELANFRRHLIEISTSATTDDTKQQEGLDWLFEE